MKVTLLFFIFLSFNIFAVTKTWNNAGGSAWTTAGNWSPSGVPSVGDDVIFNTSATFTVTAVPTIALNSLQITSGTVTLQSGAASNTLTVTSLSVSASKSLIIGTTSNILTLKMGSSGSASISGSLNITRGYGALDVNGQTFNFGTTLNVITGTTTLATGDIINSSASAGEISSAIAFSNAHTTLNIIGDLIFSGIISGLGGGGFDLRKYGTGKLILSNASNTFTAVLKIYAGSVSASANGNISTLNSVTLDAGTLEITNDVSFSKNITLTSNSATISVASAKTFTYTGTLAGAFSLAKTGAGVFSISNTSNTNSGTISITAGTIKLAAAGVIADAAPLSISSGAILDMNGFSETVGSIAGAGTIDGTSGTPTLTFGSDNSSPTFSGIIQNTAGTLSITKTGTGTLTLSGANTFSGQVSIQNGTISVASLNNVTGGTASSNLGVPSSVANGTIKLGSTTTTGILAYTGSGETTDRVIDLAGTTFGGTIDASGTGALIFSSNLTATGAGTKTFTLTGTSSNNNAVNGVIVNNSVVNTTALTKSGTGTWLLGGTNTYTGITSINAGTISVSTIGNGGAAGGIGQATNSAANLVLGGGNLTYTGGTASTDRNFTLTAATTSTITISSSSANLTISGTSAATTGGLTKMGSGTLTLSGANNHTGVTSINEGEVSVSTIANGGVAGGLGKATNAAGNIVLGGGTLTYTGVTASSDRSYTLTSGSTSTINISSGAATLTISGAAASTTGALIKTGSGSLAFSGANAYTGTTTITAGSIILSTSSEIISNSSNLILNGGTFSTGSGAGVTETLGTLAMTESSTINLGTGSHSLTFSSSSAESWTSGKTLTITGWSGPAGSGAAGRIYIGSSNTSLTSAQLAQITFSGTTASGAKLLTTGELVPASITYYSKSGTAPNTAVNWNSNRDGVSGYTPSGFTMSDIFIIQSGHTLTTSGAWSITGNEAQLQIEGTATLTTGGTIGLTGSYSKLLIKSGAILTASHQISLAATDTLTIESTGKYVHNNTTTSTSTKTFAGVENFDANSTIEFKDFETTSGAFVTCLAASTTNFGNVIWNITTGSTAFIMNSSSNTTRTINGDFTVTSTGATGSLTWQNGGSTGKFTVSGDYTQTAGTFRVTGSGVGSSTSILEVLGSFNISGGIFDISNTLTYYATVYLGGNFTMTNGTFTNSGGNTSPAVYFTKSGSQTFTQSGGTFTTSNINFTINSGSIVTLASDFTSSRTLTVSSGGTLIIPSGYKTTGAGSTVLSSGSTLKIGDVNGIVSAGTSSGAVQTTTRTYNTGVYYEYNGTSAQVTGSGIPSSNTNGGLIINNSAGVTLSANHTLGGTGYLTLTSGVLSTSSFTLTISNSSTSAITAYSSTSYVSGILNRYIATASSQTGNEYVFPIGKSGNYYPFKFSDYTASSTPSITAEAFSSTTGTASTGLSAVSNTEYWKIIYNGANPVTDGRVSIGSSGAASYNAIGTSTSSNSAYTTLGGSLNGTIMSATTSVGTVTNTTKYYVLATSSGSPYSGTYSVGPGQTWTNITTALTAIKANGLAGSVILDLLPTYVSTGETFPITFDNYLGTTSSKSITVRPNSSNVSALTITSNNSTATINLKAVEYIIFDGRPGGSGTDKYLNIDNTYDNSAGSATGACALLINYDASNNTVKYVNLSAKNIHTASASTPTTGVINIVTGAITGSTNNLFDHCLIDGKASGATPTSLIAPTGIYSSTSTGTNTNTVKYTEFKNFAFINGTATISSPIRLSTGNSTWTIHNNYFYDPTARANTSASNVFAIKCIHITTGDGYTITDNYIGGIDSTASSSSKWTGTAINAGSVSFFGMDLTLGTTNVSSIQGNKIKKLDFSVYNNAIYGINVNEGYVDIGSTSANIIGDTTVDASSAPSIKLTQTGTIGQISSFYGIKVKSTASGSNNIKNNIIGGIGTTNSASNYGFAFYGITAMDNSSTPTYDVSSNKIGSKTNTDNIVIGGSSTTTTPIIRARGIHCPSSGTNTINSNIIGNITSFSGHSDSLIGIDCNGDFANSGDGIYNISQNTIIALKNSSSAAGSGFVIGIAFSGANQLSLVQRNRMTQFSNANTTSPLIAGITHNSTGIVTTQNNVFTTTNGALTNPCTIYGIAASSTATMKLYHNTISIGGTASSGALNSAAFYYNGGTANKITAIKNNIFQNIRTGGTGKHYSYYLNTTTAATANTIDYNYFDAPVDASFAYVGASDRTSSALKAATQGYGGANSRSGNITITAATGYVPSATTSDVKNTGTDLITSVTVSNDFNNTTRSITPWMGAFEGATALPVELITFNSTCNGNYVDLEWETATEMNADYFNIEKSINGKDWETISTVKAVGNSIKKQVYSTTDYDVRSSTIYYRLVQYDLNGKFKKFDIVSSICETEETFLIYPNPSQNNFNLLVNHFDFIGTNQITITDLLGQIVLEKEAIISEGTNNLLFQKIEKPGVYILNISNEKKQSKSIKFIVQ